MTDLTPFTTKDTKDTKGGLSLFPVALFFVSFVFLVAAPQAANAQIYESIGIRAQGMSGAFVAVSDDATTTWWNPAGLAGGGYFSAIFESDRTEDPASTRARAIAVNVPSLGLSYYRLALNGMRLINTTATPSTSREDQGVLSQFGATVGQSVGPHLILATTLKLVHALGDFETDVDTGAMVALGRVRIGLAVKNLRTPEFSNDEQRLELPRQVRVGASVKAGPPNRAEITAAVDADLTTTATLFGDERHLATGIEAMLANRSLGIRAGVGINTVGDTRRSGSVGLSLGLRGGLYVDGQLTQGSDVVRNGWGFALRLTF